MAAGHWQPDRIVPGSGDMAPGSAPRQRWPSGRHGPGRPDAFRPQVPFQHQGEHGKPREHQLWPMLHLAAGVLSLPANAYASNFERHELVLTWAQADGMAALQLGKAAKPAKHGASGLHCAMSCWLTLTQAAAHRRELSCDASLG